MRLHDAALRVTPTSHAGRLMTAEEFQAIVGSVIAGQRVSAADGDDDYGVHYTRSPDLPCVLLRGAVPVEGARSTNVMRQYDGDYMNDPEEGRYLPLPHPDHA